MKWPGILCVVSDWPYKRPTAAKILNKKKWNDDSFIVVVLVLSRNEFDSGTEQ